jgi:hypothetical protein
MRNDELLESDLNKTFEDVLWMTDDEFRGWFTEFRELVVHLWDTKDLPPRVGKNEDELITQFKKMYGFAVHEFEHDDENTGEHDVFRNTSIIGNGANEFFPTMMKTRINYTKGDKGLSIYDHFAKPELLDKTVRYAMRHFKRDSFYQHSQVVRVGKIYTVGTSSHKVTDAESFVEWFENNARQYDTHDYWIEQRKGEGGYTGYNIDLKTDHFLPITKEQISSLNIPDICKTNLSDDRPADYHQIRIFEKGEKLFPAGFKAFRVSWCQVAVNFPPLTAKYLYEKFTRHVKDQPRITVYDPSAGWGGRILGAMSARTSLPLHYVGTDPNTDHTVIREDGSKTTKYEMLAEFYNNAKNQGTLFKSRHTYEVFQSGSEVIKNLEAFQKYEGELDMVFTSPPYFAKEAYSEDPTQSYKKFTTYEVWRDGFLRPTLETAVAYLKNDRYLLWNIADAKFGAEMLPLEQDSKDILENLGMISKGVVKMSLAQMPGANRVDEDTGKPKSKNFCKVNGNWLKYEPVFVFYKP